MNSECPFKTTFQVRIGDINYGGHLGNEQYLLLFHDARLKFLNANGFSEMDIGENVGLIMSEGHVNYKAEVFYGDELTVGVTISEIIKIRFRIDYVVERARDQKVVATGYTWMVAFDYHRRKVSKIPTSFLVKMGLVES